MAFSPQSGERSDTQAHGTGRKGRALERHTRRSAAIGSAIFFAVSALLVCYFVFAAVQGTYGHFQRVQIEADKAALERQLAALQRERAILQNKTRRLSDAYLDLDLLDERARKVLGLARGDEIVIR